MAHLRCNHSSFVQRSQKGFYCPASTSTSWKTRPCHNNVISFSNQTRRFKKNKVGLHFVHCCTSSSSTSATPSDQQVNLDAIKELDLNGTHENEKLQQFGYLASDVNWHVRRMVDTENEMKKVAGVQAEAFHEPVLLFDDLFFEFFKAEVLSGLLYRLKNSPPDRYACLVAEAKSSDTRESDNEELAGVVDVTVQREASVLQHLPGAKEYLYVSGIAVLKKFRRQKVATTLLRACDALSAIWGFEYLVLRAYEDDYGARKLYLSAGYRVVSGDPLWTTTWIGRRRRVVMVKQIQ